MLMSLECGHKYQDFWQGTETQDQLAKATEGPYLLS